MEGGITASNLIILRSGSVDNSVVFRASVTSPLSEGGVRDPPMVPDTREKFSSVAVPTYVNARKSTPTIMKPATATSTLLAPVRMCFSLFTATTPRTRIHMNRQACNPIWLTIAVERTKITACLSQQSTMRESAETIQTLKRFFFPTPRRTTRNQWTDGD